MHKVIQLLPLLLLLTPLFAADQLRVLKQGEQLFIRSSFSAQEDLVVRVGKGANRQFNYNSAFLIKAEAGMTVAELSAGRMIHANGDDATPWNLNGTYIGANHGCSDGREITVPNHGLTTADLGSQWADTAGSKFVLLKLVDANRFWVMSINHGAADIWKSILTVKGPTLTRVGGAGTLTFTECKMAQLTPCCRFSKQEVLVDGKQPLADDTPTTCAFLDLVETYDIINPASLVQDFIDHPGEARSFTGDSLAAIVRNHIVYRFYPNGANVITTNSEALQDFNLGYMGFIQSAKLTHGNTYDSHIYYIPKTVPFTQDNINYDFRGGQDYSGKLPSALYFSAANKNISDPQNLPERFLQFLGHKTDAGLVNDVGYALGYSLTSGMTVPAIRAKNAGQALFLYTSSKSYPHACDGLMGNPIKAGTKFDCVAYRQYFWPGAQKNATACYWHPEGQDIVVYADVHKAVDHDALALPAEFAGRTLSVIEHTPSVTLHSQAVSPTGAVEVSVADGYGAVVFRVKGTP